MLGRRPEAGSRAAMLDLPRPPRQAALAVAGAMACVRSAARGGASAAVRRTARLSAACGRRVAGAHDARWMRSNNDMHRSRRSAVLVIACEAARRPADVER